MSADGTILAFDYGERRVGVACANSMTGLAHGLTTLRWSSSEELWRQLDELIADWQPVHILVGLPEMDTTGDTRRRSQAFAEEIKSRYELSLDMVPEHLTSFAARSELKEARQSGRKKRRVKRVDIDTVAARLIAEQWLAMPTERRV